MRTLWILLLLLLLLIFLCNSFAGLYLECLCAIHVHAALHVALQMNLSALNLFLRVTRGGVSVAITNDTRVPEYTVPCPQLVAQWCATHALG